MQKSANTLNTHLRRIVRLHNFSFLRLYLPVMSYFDLQAE